MAAVNDILQTVLRSTYLGQNIVNVFHYRIGVVGTVPNSAANLNSGIAGTILTTLRPMVNAGFQIGDLYTVNLGTPAEMDTYIFNLPGTHAGAATDYLPSYMALKFKFERTSASFRNGWKRFAGLVEDMVSGNSYSGNTTLTGNMATVLGQGLAVGTGTAWNFQPFIARRPIVYGVNPAGYQANTVSFQGVTTQNTRKP